MHVLPGRTRSSVAAVLAVLIALAHRQASADESAGHNPFGVLKREGFVGVTRPGAAEHEALFRRPEEPKPDPWGATAPSGTPADDVVFAAPVLSASQDIVTGSTNRLRPPTRPEEGIADAWGAAAQSNWPTADVVFAAPVLSAAQEIATGWTNTLPPWRLGEATTDAWGVAQSSRPTADVVFAAPMLSAVQEIATGWTDTPVPPPRPEEPTTDPREAAAPSGRPADAVVFAAPVLPTSQELVTGWTGTPVPHPHPEEPTTQAGSGIAQASRPADDVVFGEPALPVGQETVTGPSNPLLPPPLIAATADAVVFGPPSGGTDTTSTFDRPAGPSVTPDPPNVATAVRALAPEDAARLKARARGLLASGSLAPARALLEDAASRGDAEGTYLLAQTYDPEALTRSGMIGVAGDAAKAGALYRAAQLGGYPRPDKNARAAQP